MKMNPPTNTAITTLLNQKRLVDEMISKAERDLAQRRQNVKISEEEVAGLKEGMAEINDALHKLGHTGHWNRPNPQNRSTQGASE